MRPKDLLRDLAEKARTIYSVFGRGAGKHPTPGELVEKLSPREREILAQLKSNDVNNVRWP